MEQVLSIVGILADDTDPLVSVMKVSMMLTSEFRYSCVVDGMQSG